MTVLEYNPPSTVGKLLTSPAVIRGIVGPFGSGKSVGCVMALVKNALEQPPNEHGVRHSRHVIVRNTYRMLADTTIKTVLEWLPDGVAGRWFSARNTFVLKFKDVESEWLFRALDKPDDVRNLLSLEVTSAWINEYREIDPEILVNLLGRIGRFPGKRMSKMRGVVMDSNPPPVGSYWYEFFEEGIPEDVQATLDATLKKSADGPRPVIGYFRQPSGLSPEAENVEHLPEGYYELLLAANKHRGEDWVKVHVHGEYGLDPANTPVYPGYRASLHAPRPFPYKIDPDIPLYVGMDFGKTPAAVLTQEYDNGRWPVFAELVTENCTTREFIPKYVTWLRRFTDINPRRITIIGDPSSNREEEVDRKNSFVELRSAGFTVLPGAKGRDKRISAVRTLLDTLIEGTPALVIDVNNCPTLARGFAGEYKYGRTATGDLHPQPVKNKFSHPHDALNHLLGRMAAIHGGKPRDTITTVKPWSVYGRASA